MQQPFADMRVLELATGVSGPFLGKMLADFGAEVIKVEPPSGDPNRAHGPFDTAGSDTADHDIETGALHLHLNTNKRSAVADITTAAGRDLVADLASTVDVVIESFAPGTMESLGLDHDALQARRPGIVLTSVTPFGQSGPYSERRGADIVTYAMGGPMWGTGIDEASPVKLGGEVISYQAGNVAAVATVAAWLMSRQSGQGTHIDLSCFESQAGTIDRRVAYLLYQAWTGQDVAREARQPQRAMPIGFYPTLDGHVLTFTIPSWVPRMLLALGDDELAAHYADPNWLFDEDLPDLVDATLYPWLLSRTRQEAAEDAQ
ncbi:MAG: CoA transferase, partial [Actinomycetota bacterium]|nr:CoA transferase [Actinomycetota bacterium]